MQLRAKTFPTFGKVFFFVTILSRSTAILLPERKSKEAMMSTASVFNCPSCGAALGISLKRGNAQCPYCRNTIVVPQLPTTMQDLQSEQMEVVNSAIQSAMEMQSKQAVMASGILKSTMPVVVGGTIVVPLIITAVTFILIICIFGFVWYSFGSMFSLFR